MPGNLKQFILPAGTSLLAFAGTWIVLIVFTDLAIGYVLVIASAVLTIAAAAPSWRPHPEQSHPVQPAQIPARPGRRVRVGRIPRLAHCYQQQRAARARLRALAQPGATIIVTGMGGVGKTQLAAEIARRAIARRVRVMIWTSATTTSAIVSSYAEAAVKILGADPGDQPAAARRFLDWLADTARSWLIVLDDLARPADLNDWWPVGRAGTVIVTTRRRDSLLTSYGRQRIEVDLFTTDETVSYLSEAFRTQPQRLVEVTELAEDLGRLPLALAQAVAYIADSDLTCAQYRARLNDRRQRLAELLPEQDDLDEQYGRTLEATFTLSIEAVDQMKPAGLARPTLLLASMLDSNGAPVAALTSQPALDFLTRRQNDPAGAPKVSAERASDALARLGLLSLAIPAQGDGLARVVRVHALIQRIVRDQASKLLDDAAWAAADALTAIWPDIDRNLPLAELLRANTEALLSHARQWLWQTGAHRILFRHGESLGKAGLVEAAVNHFDELAGEAARVLGSDHRDTLRARDHLAYWRGKAGHVDQALTDTAALVTDCVRLLGSDDPVTMLTRSGLALWQGLSGDVGGAAATSAALLADRTRVLGANHQDTLRTRLNAAHWQGKAGDPAGAAAASEVLLTDYVRVLGWPHPHTLYAGWGLAYWRGRAGDLAGAAVLLKELIHDYRRVFGPTSPDTFWVRSDLAYWWTQIGEAARAVAELEALLADCGRVLSPSHPLIAKVRLNLSHARDTMNATERRRRWPRPRRSGERDGGRVSEPPNKPYPRNGRS